MFGNYIRSMPKISGADSKSSARTPGSNPTAMPRHSKGGSGSGKATAGTRCQKCEKFGHYTYNCPVKNAPYKSRPTRTQQLINPKAKRDTPTVEVPQEFLSKKGIAAKILGQKEQERSEQQVGVPVSKPQKAPHKKSSASDSETSSSGSSSSSDSSSDSDSDSDSSASSSSVSQSSLASQARHNGHERNALPRSPVRRRQRSRSSSSRDSGRSAPRKRITTAPVSGRQKRQRSRSRSLSSQQDDDEIERRREIKAGKQREIRRD